MAAGDPRAAGSASPGTQGPRTGPASPPAPLPASPGRVDSSLGLAFSPRCVTPGPAPLPPSWRMGLDSNPLRGSRSLPGPGCQPGRGGAGQAGAGRGTAGAGQGRAGQGGGGSGTRGWRAGLSRYRQRRAQPREPVCSGSCGSRRSCYSSHVLGDTGSLQGSREPNLT